uniref:SOUL heme-binding protein n=1 Tax=Grammatophora oceanica TaxID=210454 RepID=A0A7S1YAX7_9STRA|mmetsp:Transcript_36994/g.55093  ORF Transcript_36994/g.55093 Transcript_36994/m.55093 type:complete len:220 (+) Transcript_36994:324-983(+)|eukprot:CAMPEP_0194033624 /NCGR_PEP_ID=MMETSP0009_2-20130614/6239_1 /TAXON_ID=210454 /ORGANISM="Grammatophora oceanica, Strain CCMP 410" /LENGTH=219 /DNA_ID=CAMNT_0038674339 /DNA_START=289 /DNA_END=948 /DNA_ORIENTATION=-
MGMIFGKETVAEPPFSVVLTRAERSASLAYEVRKYEERFGAEVSYPDGNSDDGTPFGILARYIGVFGDPENEGNEKISMTAPVVKQGGTPIAMTAPVVKSEQDGEETMMFMLPTSYDELSKIPKPTDPRVSIREMPPEFGAVHRFNGSFDDDRAQKMATELGSQLRQDGVDISESDVLSMYQFWGYNPPFTIPYFRRNEVWIPLTQAQVDTLQSDFSLN